MSIYEFLAIFLVLMNTVGFTTMWIDKQNAIKGKWRISEKSIFTIALLCGAVGVNLGMYKFRHKTKHWYFVYGIPSLIIVNIYIVYLFIKYGAI